MANLAALPLGTQTSGQQLRIAIDAEVLGPKGNPVTLRALYDSGAELNLIRRDVARQLELTEVSHKYKPEARFLDENKLQLHSAHYMTLNSADKHGIPKSVGPQTFWAAPFVGYDLILGYPWLAEADPKIRFSDGTFEWWDAEAEHSRIEVAEATALLGDLSLGEQVYALYPGDFSAEHSGSALEDATTTPTPLKPRVPDGQVPESTREGEEEQCAPGGDKPALLWRKEWMTSLSDYLERCVRSDPSLQWLPSAVMHRVIEGNREYRTLVSEPTLKGEANILAVSKDSSAYYPAMARVGCEDYADTADKALVPECLWDQLHVFNAQLAGQTPLNTEYDHAIELEEGKTPPNLPIYNLSRRELEILREYLENALEKGWVRHSKSPAGAPILFVPKADGTLRLCVDYRGLNKITIKNRYPIPLVSEMLDRLSKASIFTKLDLRDAYHRLRIKEGDEWKTAFKTRYGHFEYTVMPFGLANAPATFQSYIHRAIGGLLDITCIVYLDDILIYSGDEAEHERHVREVLERLYEWGLFVKASKCTFFSKSVEFLGFIVTPNGVVMDPVRVQTIREWPEPTCYRDIQVFLGFANFYRRFIYNYSAIVRPLLDHMTAAQVPPADQTGPDGKPIPRKTKKGPTKWYAQWSWPEAVRQAFLEIRERFTQAPVLQHFDPNKPIMVITDASEFAMAAICLQPQSSSVETERHWKPIAYLSKKFVGPQVRWHTHDKELYAIVESFSQWRHYLEHAPDTIRVLTDHNNLRYFMTTKELTPKQARWAEELARFDFEIEYKPGAQNPADAPSRRPDYAEGFQGGEARSLRDVMLPTLQNKLRVWALRRSTAVCAEVQAACALDSPGGDPTELHRSPVNGTKHPTMEFHSASLPDIDMSSPVSSAHSTKGEETELGVQPRAVEVLTAFLRNPNLYQTCASRKHVVAALHNENAFNWNESKPFLQYIQEVQFRDAAYHEKVTLAERGRKGDAKKGDPHWIVDPQGILRRAGKVWIPSDQALRHAVLSKNHDDPLGGHYGVDKTIELLKQKYHWPQLRKDVHQYVSKCATCQLNKIRRHKPWGLLEPIPPPTAPWRDFSLDFITELPESRDDSGKSHDSVLVLVDRFTKLVRYLPVNKSITATQLADLLFTRCFTKQGPPSSLISDRGSVFTSEFWSDVCFHMRTKLRLSTAFHPQTDGQTERQNQELESFLRMYANYQQDNWVQLLPLAEYAYNSKKHAAHGQTPIRVAYGIDSQGFDGVPDDYWLRPAPQDWNDAGEASVLRRKVAGYLNARAESWANVEDALRNAQEHQQLWYNSKRTERHYAVGDLVIVKATNIKTRRPCKKLDARYFGPFRILQKHGKLAYRVELPPSMARLHPVFHVSLLEKWEQPPREANFEPGPVQHPELAEDDNYEVEAILAHKTTYGTRRFLVKWLGWPLEKATWEPEANLDNCEGLLREYWERPNGQDDPQRRGARPGSSRRARGKLSARKA